MNTSESNTQKTFGSKVQAKNEYRNPERRLYTTKRKETLIEEWESAEKNQFTDKIAVAEAAIRDFQSDSDTTGRSFKNLMDLVNGKYTKYFAGSEPHSSAEYHLAGLLYGVFREYADSNDVQGLTRRYITYACRENRYADDGDVRKWLRRSVNGYHTFNYRQETVGRAIRDFNRNVWERWRSTKESWDTWSDDYSDIVYQAVFDALVPRNGRYPTRKEVIEIAQSLNPERSKETHETALRRLQSEYQQVKMAFCPDRENGKRYVYYPAHDPDPADARWVKIGGEKHDPKPRQKNSAISTTV